MYKNELLLSCISMFIMSCLIDSCSDALLSIHVNVNSIGDIYAPGTLHVALPVNICVFVILGSLLKTYFVSFHITSILLQVGTTHDLHASNFRYIQLR
jgi:hypothetical protein